MSNTSWVTASWRSRPTMFAALTAIATALSTVTAHVLAGGALPSASSAVMLVLGLGASFEAVRRFPGSVARLLSVSLTTQFGGHLVLAATTRTAPQVDASQRPRGLLASGGAPCGLHDLSALTLPGPENSSSGVMLVAHLLGAVGAVLLMVVTQGLAALTRTWVRSLVRRLHRRPSATIRHRGVAHRPTPMAPRLHLVGLSWRGPPAIG